MMTKRTDIPWDSFILVLPQYSNLNPCDPASLVYHSLCTLYLLCPLFHSFRAKSSTDSETVTQFVCFPTPGEKCFSLGTRCWTVVQLSRSARATFIRDTPADLHSESSLNHYAINGDIGHICWKWRQYETVCSAHRLKTDCTFVGFIGEDLDLRASSLPDCTPIFNFLSLVYVPHPTDLPCPSHLKLLLSQRHGLMVTLFFQCVTTVAQETYTPTGRWSVSSQRTQCECSQQSWVVRLVRILHNIKHNNSHTCILYTYTVLLLYPN